MQSKTPEIEPMRYVESPWLEDQNRSHAFFPELFPEVADKESGSGWSAAGSMRAGGGDGMSVGGAGGFSHVSFQENGSEQLFRQLLATETHKAEERGRIDGRVEGQVNGRVEGRAEGHTEGMEMGLALGREELVRQLQDERERLFAQAAAQIESFSSARESYLHQLEQESVKLALAIAARILRREAQMDPLLLTGAVRVALGQLAASTSVRLRVPAQDQPMWEEALTRMPGLAIRPQVVGEPRMDLGDCRMETELGSADLGLWPQLKEIERGFFDRVPDRVQDRINTQPEGRFGSSEGDAKESTARPADAIEDGQADDATNFAVQSRGPISRPISGPISHAGRDEEWNDV